MWLACKYTLGPITHGASLGKGTDAYSSIGKAISRYDGHGINARNFRVRKQVASVRPQNPAPLHTTKHPQTRAISLCTQGQSRPSGGRGRGGGANRPRIPSRPNNQQRRPPQQFRQQDDNGDAYERSRSGRQSKDDPPMNSDITCGEVRVLDSKRDMLGIMPTAEAQNLAVEEDTDLLMINPEAEPPLCRLVDLTKYKYELAKADKDQRKKQRESRQDLKELKFRPNTDVHDYDVRLKHAKRFLSKGDKVKLTMQFKGREMEFQSLGREMFDRFVGDLGEEATVAQNASMQGYSMTLIISPNKRP